MRNVKMLGLLAIAAMALTASIAVPSASADLLCKTQPVADSNGNEKCPSGQTYPVGTVINASLTSTLNLKSSMGTISCTSSTWSAKLTSEGSPLYTLPEAEVTGYTFGGCNFPIEALRFGKMKFAYWGKGGQGYIEHQGLELRMIYLGQPCTYQIYKNSTPRTFAVTGGNPAQATENAGWARTSGTGCPNTLEVSGTYSITSPTPLYFSMF